MHGFACVPFTTNPFATLDDTPVIIEFLRVTSFASPKEINASFVNTTPSNVTEHPLEKDTAPERTVSSEKSVLERFDYVAEILALFPYKVTFLLNFIGPVSSLAAT